MSDLFNAVVQLFNYISITIGLPYHELNILIYTFLMPAIWWAIVWLRMRRFLGLGLLHMAIPLFHYVETAQHSRRFYDANVAALLYLGGNTDEGYIKVSIVAGIVFPVMIYLALFFVPKQRLVQLYFALLLTNMIWYGWVLTRF